MTLKRYALLVFIFSILFLVSQNSMAQQSKKVVAIPMFSGTDSETAKVLSDLFGTKLAAKNAFRVLTRTNIDKLMEEIQYQQSGLTSNDDAVSLGKQLNANYIVYGNLTTLGKLQVLYVQLINVETGEIVSGSEKKFEKIEDAYDYIDDLVGILVGKITGEKYDTVDERKFDKDKLLSAYKFNKTMVLVSRVTWITGLSVAVIGGMIATDRGAKTDVTAESMVVPALGSIVFVGGLVSDIVFSIRGAGLRKEMDQRNIKYAFVPSFNYTGGKIQTSASMLVSFQY